MACIENRGTLSDALSTPYFSRMPSTLTLMNRFLGARIDASLWKGKTTEKRDNDDCFPNVAASYLDTVGTLNTYQVKGLQSEA